MGALHVRVVGLWNGEMGQRVGGTGNCGDGDERVDVDAVELLCEMRSTSFDPEPRRRLPNIV